MSDYRDERVGLRRRVEELEQRLRELLEEEERISVYLDSDTRTASRFNRPMRRLGQVVGRLIRGRRTSVPNETAILRAQIARLEERIMQVETTVAPYRWPRKTSPFYEEAASHGRSENTEMDSAAYESTDDAPGEGGHGKS